VDGAEHGWISSKLRRIIGGSLSIVLAATGVLVGEPVAIRIEEV